jgi:hypothetical protein
MAAKTFVRSDYKEIAALGAASGGLAFSFFGSIYVSAVMVGTGFGFYLWGRRRGNNWQEAALYGFVRALLRSYKRTRSMLKSLGEASTGHSVFEKEVRDALEKYRAGDIGAFSSCVSLPQNGHSKEALGLVERALVSGDDVYVELCRLKYSIRESIDSGMKRLGMMNNARFVSLLGIVLFFPLFAGIGTAIIAAAPQPNAGAGVSITSITLVFAAYLMIECFVHFKGDANLDRFRKAASVVLSGSFALLLLKVGSILAIGAI